MPKIEINNPIVPRGPMQVRDTRITNAQVRSLRATPITLIPSPGANKAIVVHKVYLLCDATAGVYTESTDNLVVQYNGGVDITAGIEATGFLTVAGSAQARTYGVRVAEIAPEANVDVEIFNTGNGEYGGGNAANSLSVRVWYSIVDTVAFPV